MRCLVIADIHANLAAFESVLEAAGAFDEIWCLGDLVGYGPDPDECVELLRQHPHVAVVGNHDWAAIGRLDLCDFNPSARAAAEWTRDHLRPATRRYLERLALTEKRGAFTIVHGSPRQPVWEYIDEPGVARDNLVLLATPYGLVGHTHVPVVCSLDTGCVPAEEDSFAGGHALLSLGAGPLIINPGSVGQPRDGDPRAAYAVVDPDAATAELWRVDYPVSVTQERIAARGLPERNAFRLGLGR